jgi:hypothetical protein
MVPNIGILGAGLALLVSELAISIGYLFFARQWLGNNGLIWPKRSFISAVGAVCVAGLSIGALVLFPSVKWLIVSGSLLLLS